MKRLLLALPLILLTGCLHLMPGKVEYFQSKVKAVPQLSDAAKEHQRQAAAFVAEQTAATEKAAVAEHSSTNVLAPASAANQAASALSESLGPPKYPWLGDVGDLSFRLHHDQAEHNEDLADYARKVQKNVGKKIEGTGFFQIGYFTQWGIVLGVIALIWVGVRLYGLFNPVVGTAAGVVGRVSSSVLHKGFSELVTGGQQFIQWVESSKLDSEAKAWVVNAFKLAHQTAQSPDVQQTVDKLKVSPTTTAQPL